MKNVIYECHENIWEWFGQDSDRVGWCYSGLQSIFSGLPFRDTRERNAYIVSMSNMWVDCKQKKKITYKMPNL